MRRVVVYTLLSLDGVAEAPEEFLTDWDDVLDANLAEVIGTQDAVLLGRRSHDEWAAYWPDSDDEPFATFINGVAKYVVTSTPLARDWPPTTVLDGGPADAVRALRAEPGGDIGVHASITLARSLLAAGVVDQLRLVVAPRIAGHGSRFLDDLPTIGLDLLESQATPTGAVLLRYRVRPATSD